MRKTLIVSLLVSLLVSCQNPETQKAVDTPPKKNSEDDYQSKATVAPQFEPQQFKKGQFWVWQNKKTKKCFRFLVEAINSEGIKLHVQHSLLCQEFDSDPRVIVFNPFDGTISKNESELSGLDKSIYPVFYGSDVSVFLRYRSARDFSYLPLIRVFNIKGTESWFVDMPGTLLHAILYENSSLKLISAGKL